MRTIIIGDIHGCARTFSALLATVKPDPDQDKLILLGDLFDRGPASYEVLQKVRELAATFGDRFALLMGNHEDYWLNEHPSFAEHLLHNRVGRKTTVQSFKKYHTDVESCLPWIKEHAVFFCKDELFRCVHAGIRNEQLGENDLYTLLHDHDIVLRNNYAGKLTITGHIALPMPCLFAGDGETFTELQAGEIYDLPRTGVICIDTGCGKDGALTAMVIEGEHFTLHSVPQLEVL